jgi:ubiquinone biosynthesis protein UbiJ
MLETTLLLLETAINQALKTDLQTLARLQELQNKKIKLDITDWNCAFFIIPQHHGIELRAKISGAPDTIITGKLNNLVHIGLSSNKKEAMRQHQIQFSGDGHTGIAMQQMLSHIDIDWEEQLSRLVGDTPATFISKGLQSALNIGKSIVESIRRNTEEYIHHEAKLCPRPEDLESFYQHIATLRNDVDRLEAKLNLIKRQ